MFEELERYPKQKHYLADLNSLLDTYQTQSILLANGMRKEISSQLRPKTMNMQRLVGNDLSNPSFKSLNIKNDGFLHTRSVSNFVGRVQKNSPEKMAKTLQQARKEKMVNMLSTQNFRKQLMNTRKMSAVQAQYRTGEIKSKDKKKDYDLRFNVLKNANLIHKQSSSKRQATEQNAYSKFDNQQQFAHMERSASLELRNGVDKHEYLRKNTSINKSILNTILRLKLSRNNPRNEQQKYEKYVNNDQIVKMIKVYKGVEPVNSISKPNILTTTKEAVKKQNDPLYIQGWYNQTEDFQFNRSHSPPQLGAIRQ